MYTISCFADEISPKLTEQLDEMEKVHVRWLSLRSVENVNVLDLTDEQVREIREALDGRGMNVSSIGSPIGKSPITDNSGNYLQQTARAIQIAELLRCSRIRVFSFYMRPEEKNAYRAEVIDRLTKMADLAAESGITLVLENEAGIYGEESLRCQDLLESVNRPNFLACFDPSNYVAAGEAPFDQSFPRVGSAVGYVHIKDSRRCDGVIVPAGQGDGQVSRILTALADRALFLTLEPHLAIAGKNRGFSGQALFEKAYCALTDLLKEAGLSYQ